MLPWITVEPLEVVLARGHQPNARRSQHEAPDLPWLHAPLVFASTVPLVNETLTMATPDGDMGIHVVRPDGDGPFPVIVFFHHGPGLDDGSKQAMQLLADARLLRGEPRPVPPRRSLVLA